MIVSIIIWLLRINSHPFIVLRRVSVPYPSMSVNALVTLATSLVAAVSASAFLTLRKRLKLLTGISLIINPKLLNFQLIIMLWGVPASWLSYLMVSAGLTLIMIRAPTDPKDRMLGM